MHHQSLETLGASLQAVAATIWTPRRDAMTCRVYAADLVEKRQWHAVVDQRIRETADGGQSHARHAPRVSAVPPSGILPQRPQVPHRHLRHPRARVHVRPPVDDQLGNHVGHCLGALRIGERA